MYSSKPKIATREMTSDLLENIELPSQREKMIPQRKLNFADKLTSLLDDYDTCLVIEITNIGSKQIAEMRKEFRGSARFLFGKNTLIRKIIRDHVKKTGRRNKDLMKLMDLIKGNCGLVFTKQEIKPIHEKIIKNSIKQSSAKYNSIAPCDVYLDIGPTNMEPTKTAIFQSMDIETRINRGQIDITTKKHLIKKGEKVGASEASLLSQLNIKPFYYGINVSSIYERGEITICDTSFYEQELEKYVLQQTKEIQGGHKKDSSGKTAGDGDGKSDDEEDSSSAAGGLFDAGSSDESSSDDEEDGDEQTSEAGGGCDIFGNQNSSEESCSDEN